MSSLTNPPVHITGGEAPLRHPLDFFRRMASDLLRSRHAALELFRRDLSAQRRRAITGLFALFLPALATAAWAVLFRDSRLINAGHIQVPYPLFVLCGLMLWAAFLESLEAPLQALLSEQSLLAKTTLAPEAVVAARLALVLVNTLLRAAVVAAALLWYRVPVHTAALAALPCGVLILMLLGSGFGMLLAPVNLLYRDIGKTLPLLSAFWFFLTPILYAAPTTGTLSVLMAWNPVAPLLTVTRDFTLQGPRPLLPLEWSAVAFALVLFSASFLFHRIATPIVLDRAHA